MKGFARPKKWRSAAWLVLALSLFAPTLSALAGLIGHPSAVCGAAIMSADELEQKIAKDAETYGSSVFTASETELRKISKRFIGQDPDDVKEANEAIEQFLKRSQSKEFKTSSYLFSGETAEGFLKDCEIHGNEIVSRAKENKFTKRWVITAFGIRSVMSVFAAYQFAEEGHPVMAVMAAFGVFAMGRPVVRALMTMPQTGFEKFLLEETARITRKGTKTAALNILSVSAKRSTDFEVQVTASGNRIESFAHEIVYEKSPFLTPQIMQTVKEVAKPWVSSKTYQRIGELAKDPLHELPKLQKNNPYAGWENPIEIPRAENHVDFIAMPGPDGERSILVLIAEGVE